MAIAISIGARKRRSTKPSRIPFRPFDRGSHHAAALSWANSDTAWANANCGAIAPRLPIVAVIAVAADLNIDALGHLDVLGLGRNGADKQRGSHQYPPAAARAKAIFIMWELLPWA